MPSKIGKGEGNPNINVSSSACKCMKVEKLGQEN